MKNLDNKQQVTVLKGEAKVQALFKDQAAENAAAQFNASEKNKTYLKTSSNRSKGIFPEMEVAKAHMKILNN